MYVYMYILNVIVIGFTQFYHPSILVLLTAILTMVGAIFSKMQRDFKFNSKIMICYFFFTLKPEYISCCTFY